MQIHTHNLHKSGVPGDGAGDYTASSLHNKNHHLGSWMLLEFTRLCHTTRHVDVMTTGGKAILVALVLCLFEDPFSARQDKASRVAER